MKIKGIIISTTLFLGILTFFLIENFYYTNNQIILRYPWKNALFPADFTSPKFDWVDNDTSIQNKKWELTINLKNKKDFLKQIINTPNWTPNTQVWESIKTNSNFEDITAIVKRADGNSPFFSQKAELTLKISKDSVNAPILYREIPLPFSFAEQNSQFMSFAACNVADSSGSYQVLSQFRVCGNCHSITGSGDKIALDFDAAARDKGGFFIADIDTQIVFTKKNYLSWSKMLGKSTFGMLSKMSWDGKYVVTTTKDRAVSEKFNSKEKIAYSQLFFPVNGVLTIYNTETKEFTELPGANDLNFVQTNAVWTPDGQTLIFARSKALPYDKDKHVWDKIDKNIIDDFVNGKREFKYDLYKTPFNNGKGGKPEAIKGASNNGKSNYFPAISPDGKWMIFCQSENFMMLQPDSKLFITNLETNETRELKSNLPSMNSWHSWSPNGKWVVFASKVLSMYTDLFLTHIDENGKASTPIYIERASKPNKALNYPEFVNRDPNSPINMIYDYVNIYHIQIEMANRNFERAEQLLDEYLAQAQIGTPDELSQVVSFLKYFGRHQEAKDYIAKLNKVEEKFYQIVQ